MEQKPERPLTLKQEKFCQAYVICCNASEAYRGSYNAGKMKPASINRRAKELLDNSKITARVAKLQAEHRKKHDITIERVTEMYMEDRQIAIELGVPSAAVSATTGLARLYGLDKQVHHVKHDPIAELLDEVAGNSIGPPSERTKH